jgi:ribosomal protein L40E
MIGKMKDNTSDPTSPKCPGCNSSSFTASPDGSLVCNYCQTAYVPSGQTCPLCGATHDPGAYQCPSCGADLVRKCPACGAPNPLSARKCLACGQGLQILESLFARVTGATADRLRKVREEAPAIKAQEEAASQARLAEMWATERERREALARAQAERERQERIIAVVTIIVVALVIAVVIIALAITTRSTPSPHLYPY